MKYWDQMLSKYGFDDGDAVPDGADVYRRVYILAVNALAEKLGSQVRAAAFNRSGLHNPCLILFLVVGEASSFSPDALASGDVTVGTVHGFRGLPDLLFNEAVRAAHDLEVDYYVTAGASLSKANLKRLRDEISRVQALETDTEAAS